MIRHLILSINYPYRITFAKLEYLGFGNALTEPAQYDKHKYVFKFMLEIAFPGSTVFRY